MNNLFSVAVAANGEDASCENPSTTQTPPMDGADWVELFVREMMNASNMDDARNRASRALEFLEKSIRARATAETAQGLQQVMVIHCFSFGFICRLFNPDCIMLLIVFKRNVFKGLLIILLFFLYISVTLAYNVHELFCFLVFK